MFTSLLDILRVGREFVNSTIVNWLLTSLKATQFADGIPPQFSELVECTLPEGLDLLMLLSNAQTEELLSQNTELLIKIVELPRDALAATDKNVQRIVEARKKSLAAPPQPQDQPEFPPIDEELPGGLPFEQPNR